MRLDQPFPVQFFYYLWVVRDQIQGLVHARQHSANTFSPRCHIKMSLKNELIIMQICNVHFTLGIIRKLLLLKRNRNAMQVKIV